MCIKLHYPADLESTDPRFTVDHHREIVGLYSKTAARERERWFVSVDGERRKRIMDSSVRKAEILNQLSLVATF